MCYQGKVRKLDLNRTCVGYCFLETWDLLQLCYPTIEPRVVSLFWAQSPISFLTFVFEKLRSSRICEPGRSRTEDLPCSPWCRQTTLTLAASTTCWLTFLTRPQHYLRLNTIEHSHHQNHMRSCRAGERLKLLLFIFIPLLPLVAALQTTTWKRIKRKETQKQNVIKAVTWHFLLPSDQCHSDGASARSSQCSLLLAIGSAISYSQLRASSIHVDKLYILLFKIFCATPWREDLDQNAGKSCWLSWLGECSCCA